MEDKDWIEAGKNPVWDEKEPVMGVYIRKKEDVGSNHSAMYMLRQKDGTDIGVWGSTVINARFEEIGIGSLVKITPRGEAKSQNGKTYKDYQVLYKIPREDLTDPFEDQ